MTLSIDKSPTAPVIGCRLRAGAGLRVVKAVKFLPIQGRSEPYRGNRR
jgi:hypothetical protein